MKSILILVPFILLVACKDKPCREIQAEKAAAKTAEATTTGPTVTNDGVVADVSTTTPTSAGASQLKVKVYKPDGTLQCGMGSKIPLETMEKDLKGIKVFSRANKNDGLMRIQVCGAPTGGSNVFEISRDDLAKALKAGFKEWTQD